MTLLELDHVSLRFMRGTTEVSALRKVSLSLDEGDFIAIWGASNAGKTTLLRAAAGIVAPDEGVVRFDGADLAAMSRSARTRLLLSDIGCAWRHIAESPELSVLDRLSLVLLHDRKAWDAKVRAQQALRTVNAEDCAEARWSDLPDGDRARVRLAQALVREPRLLLADEPTANLNMIEREEILGILRAIAKQQRTAVLLTAPDAPDGLRADQTLSLADGMLIHPPTPPSATVIDLHGGDGRSAGGQR